MPKVPSKLIEDITTLAMATKLRRKHGLTKRILLASSATGKPEVDFYKSRRLIVDRLGPDYSEQDKIKLIAMLSNDENVVAEFYKNKDKGLRYRAIRKALAGQNYKERRKAFLLKKANTPLSNIPRRERDRETAERYARTFVKAYPKLEKNTKKS